MAPSTAPVRTVALVGHTGVGKTTLADALLLATATAARVGRVEDGTATCDFEPEELKRRFSVSLALAPYVLEGEKVNVIDTPGFPDFLPEAERALAVADLAVVVVSAVDGVQVQTEVVWRAAEALGVPRMVFVNKLDREHADFSRVLDQLREVFGAGVAPLELPIGEEASFRGIADLLADEAICYEGGAPRRGPIPEEIAELEHRVRDSLVEGIVVADDELMERYLEGDTPSMAELEATLATGVAACSVFPVVCGSATTNVAIDRLAAFIREIAPSRPVRVRAGDRSVEVARDPSGEPLARVFKTIIDPFVGRISLLQVISGTLRPDTVLVNSRTKSEERLHALQMMRGKETYALGEAPAGDIVAVAKLADAQAGDTLAPKGSPVVAEMPPLSPPQLAVAIRPRKSGDEDKLMTSLHRLEEEDGALSVHHDEQTQQTVLTVLGDTHLNVVCERLQRKFGVEIDVEALRIPYQETITSPAEAEGRHKKQTGGHGQFGVVVLKLEPLARGEGFEFVDEIVGGAIPRQFLPAVQHGIEKAMRRGGVFGYPVVDVRARCVDGKFHSVDSSETSFEIAASLAFQEALRKANPVLLEPISRLEVRVPARLQGEVLADVNARRGRVVGSELDETGQQVITALVPSAELVRYAMDLRSLTGGYGTFSVHHDHYAEVPAHLSEKLARA
ncbi:MAG TPA: elongation factor G [Acidimicrobiales bacterium]|nr:elongation factor G [Acidimicrobiales bacterium]